MKALLSMIGCATFAQSHLVTGTISHPIDYSELKVSLNNGEYQSLVDSQGQFVVSVPDYSATYKLEVFSSLWYFEPVVIEIQDDSDKPIKAYMFSVESGKDFRLMYPLGIEPSFRISYFDERPPFDPTKYLSNPFVWMIGLSLVMN